MSETVSETVLTPVTMEEMVPVPKTNKVTAGRKKVPVPEKAAAEAKAEAEEAAKRISVASRPRTSTVYRTQGGTPPNASWRRIKVDEKGNVRIQGDKDAMLHISLDDKNHAVYFYNKRGGAAADAEVVSFKVPKKLADEIRDNSVLQDQGRKFPGAPQKVDPTRSPDAYGVKGSWIERLEREAIPGSGRVKTPQ